MSMFDSLNNPANIGNSLLAGFQQGRQMRQEEASKKALNALLSGGVNTPGIGDGIPGNKPMPGGPAVPWNDLTPQDRQTAMQFMRFNQDQQAAQQKQEQTQMVQLGRLLDYAKDETTYQQARQAAQQIGIDVSRAPANYDPAWVQRQRMVLSAFEKDGGQQISGLARELTDAGYTPGSPEFLQAMQVALQGKYAPQYTDAQGNLRQARLPGLPQPGQPQTPAQPVKETSFEAAADIAKQMGPEFPNFVRNNGFRVRVASPEQAMQLPSGTPLILPDGTEGVVP